MTILTLPHQPHPTNPPTNPPGSISAELDHCNDDKKEIKVRERRDLVGRGGRGEWGRWAISWSRLARMGLMCGLITKR